MEYRLSLLEETVGPWRFSLSCLESFESAVDDLYAALEKENQGKLLESLCPYFGVLWPGSRILARWIWSQGPLAFSGKRTLELGCGLALPSLVASRLGAIALATDSHPDVPEFLRRNLAQNPESCVQFSYLDWDRSPTPFSFHYDWILGSDILYEKHQPAALVKMCDQLLAPKGRAVILDPNRSYWPVFVKLAQNSGFRVRQESWKTMESNDEPPCSRFIELTREKFFPRTHFKTCSVTRRR